MEVLPRAIATSHVVVSSSSAPKESSESGSKNNSQVSLSSVPFLRPASALAASIVSSATPAALAVNYDDFVKRTSVATPGAPSEDFSFPELPSISLPSIELPSVELPSVDLGGASDFISTNPLALVAGLAAISVPFVVFRAFAAPGAAFGSVSAVEAYDKLSNPELKAQLLDIRAPEDIKTEGSPNLKSIKKTVLKVPYAADDDTFVDKVIAKSKDAENTTLYILDRFDGDSATVAKLLANSGFKSAYAIKGGAEGPNGWNEKELPWLMPAKAFKFDIGNLKNLVGTGEGVDVGAGDLLPKTLGIAAAAGVGFVVLSEAETTLQLLGTVAALQLFAKNFLFAEDRKKTIQELKTFLDTKIAPKDLVDDVKEIGRVLLPDEGEVKAAVATGEQVLEKELGVDSVTPESLAKKAQEKLEEEVEKRGVELPDLGAVTSDIQASAESVKSNIESAAKELQSNADEAISNLESDASKVQAEAEELASDIKSDATEVLSDVENTASELESKASAAVEPAVEEVSAAVQPAVEEVEESSNGFSTSSIGSTPTEPISSTSEAEVEVPAETSAAKSV
ncbi:uncharacterized protein [Physcomitrium patens]|uniref:Rhodanese domain-containing protein n=1 Tax=Physcomitrium patens TaxID=3218 RepID=A9SUK7_PHYPA|nr:rhodanese-like domain-containing protein 4, chloroplastic [Physcomitrium patens]XP_024386649.1 rhodanese-like domain-containing protein 4, chloroplastic [Physcomitrium patens]XP_024386650.1 rhodanese-like domain-containing protein 4, chloroplastic [Physcomitrium patens]PNR46577.1 hypothetical protein PHYPA_013696 [Physcomitrium patens]|eukprot:XP_024386648.1 rhodanese-like domain-containing protein 4, chloroplastic [Physcomitrella patens]